MKRIFFTVCLALSFTPINAMNYIKNIFSGSNITDQIEKAIDNDDFKSVHELVTKEMDDETINYYIQYAQNASGRPKKSSLPSRIKGSCKIVLGLALLYKAADYFKNEYQSLKTPSEILSRYRSVHNVMMDLACLSGVISSYGTLSAGFHHIEPRTNYKKQLLINLYLKNLLKK